MVISNSSVNLYKLRQPHEVCTVMNISQIIFIIGIEFLPIKTQRQLKLICIHNDLLTVSTVSNIKNMMKTRFKKLYKTLGMSFREVVKKHEQTVLCIMIEVTFVEMIIAFIN